MTQPPLHDPYGQPSHHYGQPGYPQYSPPVSAPGGGGYQQPPGPPGYPAHGYSPPTPPPEPPKRFTGTIIGIASLAVVAAIGIVTILFVVLSGDDESGTTTASPSESTEPTSEEPASEEPTEEVTQTAPSGDRISESEFNDWNFAYDGVELNASKASGWDYDDCSQTEAVGTLAEHGCTWATEVAYEAEDGDVRLSVIYLGLPDDGSASDLAADITADDFTMNDESYVHDFEFGRWISDSSGPYVVVTTCTATDGIAEDVAQEYLDNLHWDVTTALSFRI